MFTGNVKTSTQLGCNIQIQCIHATVTCQMWIISQLILVAFLFLTTILANTALPGLHHKTATDANKHSTARSAHHPPPWLWLTLRGLIWYEAVTIDLNMHQERHWLLASVVNNGLVPDPATRHSVKLWQVWFPRVRSYRSECWKAVSCCLEARKSSSARFL